MKIDKSELKIEDLLKTFDKKSALPDPIFKQNLRNRVVSQYNSGNGNVFDFLNTRLGIAFSGSFAAFTAVIALGIIFAIGPNIGSRNQGEVETVALSEGEKQEILANIIKNNPDNLIVQSTPAVNQSSGNTPQTITQSNVIGNSQIKGFNYSYSKYTEEAGKQFNFCGDSPRFKDIEVSEVFGFSDKNGKSYSKRVVKDEFGNLIDYSLVKVDDAILTSFEYAGGEYGITNEIEQTRSDPNGSIVIDQEVIAEYFGQNIDINNIEKLNGKEYYIIEVEDSFSCYEFNEASQKETKSFRRFLVDKTNFQVARNEYYINEIKEDNLVVRVDITSEVRDTNIDAIEREFTFEYDVKLIRADDPDFFLEDDAKVVEILSDEIKILEPSDDSLVLSYVKSKASSEWYKFDRTYYAGGKFGDDQLDFALRSLTEPQISYTLMNDAGTIDIDVYRNGLNAKEILLNHTGPSEFIEERVRRIRIGRDTFDAKAFRFYEYTDANNPVSYVREGNFNCEGCTEYILLEYNDYTYVFKFSASFRELKEIQIERIELLLSEARELGLCESSVLKLKVELPDGWDCILTNEDDINEEFDVNDSDGNLILVGKLVGSEVNCGAVEISQENCKKTLAYQDSNIILYYVEYSEDNIILYGNYKNKKVAGESIDIYASSGGIASITELKDSVVNFIKNNIKDL